VRPLLRDQRITYIQWFTIPYVSKISEKFNNVIAGTTLKLAFHSLNKLSRYIKVHKDSLSNMQKKNVVYKICCKDCNASYVEQTGRLLKTRISEHQNHIQQNTSITFIIDHRMHFNHDFDWNNVEILDVKRYYHKRLVSKMLHIKPEKWS